MVARQAVDIPLLVIVGETASGKSALALDLAERYQGEIICADARTVYQGMDIGTAKPSAAEQAQVPHHLLDVVTPDQTFSAADFKRLAEAAIANIKNRGKLPILVGGTGLYVDSVLFDFQFRAPAKPSLRAELSSLSVPELQGRLTEQGIALPANAQNPRHLIRALETGGEPAERGHLRPDAVVYGLRIERDELELRLNVRTDAMLAAGLAAEVRQLAEQYGWDAPGLSAIGYREFQACLMGEQSLVETRDLIIRHSLQYAKRQRVWFKRNPCIQWHDDPRQIVDSITTFLNK